MYLLDYADFNNYDGSTSRWMRFNFTGFPEREQVVRAELKFSTHNSLVRCTLQHRRCHEKILIDLYDINKRNIREKISSRVLDLEDNSLKSFSVDITRAIKIWQAEILTNEARKPILHKVLLLIRPFKVNLSGKPSNQSQLRTKREVQTIRNLDESEISIIPSDSHIFTYNDEAENVNIFQSIGADMKEGNKHFERSRNRSGKNSRLYRSISKRFHHLDSGPLHCSRRRLFVDVTKIGLKDTIIQPTNFEAYYCAGICEYPLDQHMNASTHAVLQAYLHRMNPGAVPAPCCVPTKYSPIHIMMNDEKNSVSAQIYQDLVVESCGCR